MSGSHAIRVSAPQGIFLSGLNTKFRAYVGGFGSGKTFVGCLDLGLFAGQHPKTVQGYFAPTYRDIRDTFWPTFDEASEQLGFRTKIKKADKEVDLFRGRAYYGTVICRSMDDPGAIVGFKVARALVDEIDIMAKDKAGDAWRKIIARMRLVIPGVENGIGVTTTPEGFRFVYDTFGRDPKPGYSMVQASTYENAAYLPPDYIDSLKEAYPSELVQAYIEGRFVNLTSGSVYRAYDRTANRSGEMIREKEPLYIGQDFNVGNMFSAVNVRRDDGLHAVEELKGILDTPALIGALKSRYEGHVIYVYPDASGGSRKTVNASESDIALLKAAGLKVRAKDSNPPVKDRILAMNAAFEKRTHWINDKACPVLAEALEQQAYDKNGEPDKTTGHDHPVDADGYLIHHEMPVVKPIHTVREMRL
ncbi:terminase family protein [Roseibacterium sp. SDUM158017]|uniref:terminase large subunit domain-containing protein n=1 Tax=Roseicyclus salinarum TaxID=3036773 RepID=UPI0024150F8A|nr:terminase family protein [Roseibacterium sp. SDUM158017]MDG4650103.1 terminase family protein [Roseibacterium sp. SDUM158017]